VIRALKTGKLGALAIDVYEEEKALFCHDHSSEVIEDDTFQRLMTFQNAIVSGHRGCFTREAVMEISDITLRNMVCFKNGLGCNNTLVSK
jgi:D-lactate dehydrogenase